MNRVERICFA